MVQLDLDQLQWEPEPAGAAVPPAPKPGGPTRHRRRRPVPMMIVMVLVIVLLAAVVWARFVRADGARRATVRVSAAGGVSTIALSDGQISLGQLSATLQKQNHAGLVTAYPGGGYEVGASVTVGAGATLAVADTPVFLLSDARRSVRITVASGGRADFTRDTITSWNDSSAPDTDLVDGRADIVATGAHAELDFTDSTVAALGADATDPGVSWLSGATGSVLDSTFTNDYRGLYAGQSGRLTISGSTFMQNTENGAELADPGPQSSVANSTFTANGSNGLEVDSATSVTLSSVRAQSNGFSGVALHSDTTVSLRDSLVYQNKGVGVTITGSTGIVLNGLRAIADTDGVDVTSSTVGLTSVELGANSGNGLSVAGTGGTVTLTASHVDHNHAAGLAVAGGRVVASGNTFDEDYTGVLVATSTPDVAITGNKITDSPDDGIAITLLAPTQVITGNTISGSAKAAYSIPPKSALKLTPLEQANTAVKGQPLSRNRTS